MTLAGKIALVTGASRGIGKGIAQGLGEAEATVYFTGRTVDESAPTVPLAGSLNDTAEQVRQAGGTAIPVNVDHNDDQQVAALIERIYNEHGRLDVLVNNAWRGYEGFHTGTYPPPDTPIWERPLSLWNENFDGARWAYVTSVLAAKRMIAHGDALIVNISVHMGDPGFNVPYNAAKVAVNRMTEDLAFSLKEKHIAVISLFPGLVRTEGVLLYAQYFDMTDSESPLFSGRAIAALAGDARIMQKSGQALWVKDLAKEYGFEDLENEWAK